MQGRTTSAPAAVRRVLGLAWAGAAALAAPFTAAADPAFSLVVSNPIEVGTGVVDFALVDLNQDGNVDAVVTTSSEVTVLLGQNDGTFGPGASIADGQFSSMALADLDADGRLDLVLCNTEPAGFTVLLGDGSGGFRRLPTRWLAGDWSNLAAGDLDMDGRAELAVAIDRVVTTFPSNGDGTFGAGQDYALPAPSTHIAIGDLNADGWPELAVGQYPSGLSVLLGRGDGSFAPAKLWGAGCGPVDVAFGDLDGDNRVDLVAANSCQQWPPIPQGVTLLLGTGYGELLTGRALDTRGSASSVEIADLNDDGWPDLAVAASGVSLADREFQGSGLAVLLGQGGGRFAPVQLFQTGRDARVAAVGDLDHDRRADVVVATRSTLSIFFGRRSLLFQSRSDLSTGADPRSLALGDLNGDGHLDLVVAHALRRSVRVLLGGGDGSFSAGTDFGTTGVPHAVAVADLDQDGYLDLVVANAAPGVVRILFGQGDGLFDSLTDLAVGTDPAAVAIGDLDGDGRDDLAVANAGSNTISVRLDRGERRYEAVADVATAGEPRGIALGDLDGDGHVDLTVANTGAGSVSWMPGSGDGTFRPRHDFQTGKGPRGIALADLDGDSRLDLVVTDVGRGGVCILRGRPDGGLDAPSALATGFWPTAVVIDDVDGDGARDLVVANTGSGTMSLLFGDDAGGWRVQEIHALGVDPAAIALADLDGDDRPDVVAANSGSRSLTVLRNRAAVTSVEVEGFEVAVSDGRVHLRWRLSAEARHTLRDIAVQRATSAAGPYAACSAARLQPAIEMSFEDVGLEPGSYWYRLVLISWNGSRSVVAPVSVHVGSGRPHVTALHRPFEPEDGSPIQLRYSVAGERMAVRLAVYDVRGRVVWLSERRVREPGEHAQTWDRRDRSGRLAPRGMYFVRLEADRIHDGKKLLLVHP